MTQSHQLIGPWDGTHPGLKTSPYYHGWYQHVMAAADRRSAALAERHQAEREALASQHISETVEFEIENAHIPNALPDPD